MQGSTETGRIHSYDPQVRGDKGEHSPEREGRDGPRPTAACTKQKELRPSKTLCFSLLQELRPQLRVCDSQGPWKDDWLWKCDVRYIQLQVNARPHQRRTFPKKTVASSWWTQRPPDAPSSSPVNGLESSALFLQFNTALI